MAKVITGKVRLSYLNAFAPKSVNGSAPKYSASIIIPKSDTKTMDLIRKAIAEAKEVGKVDKFGGKVPPNLKTTLYDGDEMRPDDAAYANSYYVNASSHRRPGLVYQDGVTHIDDEDDLYSGCYARVALNFYPYATPASKGIACGLNNIQKLEDGERLGGCSTAEEDFAEAYLC